MNRRAACSLASISLLFLGLALLPDEAVGQQTGPTLHKYFFRAVLTTEGIKDVQKRSATALRAGIAKFDESVGCKLKSWYFDYGNNTNYGFADCPDDVAVATLSATANAAGFARVTWIPVLSAEDMDKALTKSLATRPAQQQ
jgi:uncharacterized protein with GYD domain